MSNIVKPRRLRLMPDYECFPLWEDGEEVGNIDPTTLPISAALQSALFDWAARYDATLNHDYPPESGFQSKADEQKFVEDAEALLNRLRTELGEDYVIRLKML